VGIDTNPVAYAVGQAKLALASAEQVTSLCEELLSDRQATDRPTGEFWQLCYNDRTLEEICRVRDGLRGLTDDAAIILRALLMGILHGPRVKGSPTYLSNQMPRTYATKPDPAVRFWKRERFRPKRVDVLDAVSRRASHVLACLPERTAGAVQLDDARQALRRTRRRFSWVITSPPYYGMRTYLPDQWLRGWFLGGPDLVAYEVPEGQIATGPRELFVSDLAEVWSVVADRCLPGAHLAVRFGALPSIAQDPKALIRESLSLSRADWRIRATNPAGRPPGGARQARQFSDVGTYVEEVDVHAVLRK